MDGWSKAFKQTFDIGQDCLWTFGVGAFIRQGARQGQTQATLFCSRTDCQGVIQGLGDLLMIDHMRCTTAQNSPPSPAEPPDAIPLQGHGTLKGPDKFLQPAQQGTTCGQPAHEGLGKVRVGIRQAGQNGHPFGGDRLVRRSVQLIWSRTGSQNCDFSGSDGKIASLTPACRCQQSTIFNEQVAHFTSLRLLFEKCELPRSA